MNPTSSASPVKSRPGSSTGSIASGGNFEYIIETLVSDQRDDVFFGPGGGRNSADPSTSSSMLVMSGGEGYIDFRIGERRIKRSNYSLRVVMNLFLRLKSTTMYKVTQWV